MGVCVFAVSVVRSYVSCMCTGGGGCTVVEPPSLVLVFVIYTDRKERKGVCVCVCVRARGAIRPCDVRMKKKR